MTTQAQRKTEKQVRDEYKDRVYRLTKGKPLTQFIASRNTVRSPLVYHDLKTKENRPLRYATNFDTVFEKEQIGEAILDFIIFEDGALAVPKENLPLQVLLTCYHPGLGRDYYEFDEEGEAERELEKMNMEEDAMAASRKLTVDQYEHMYHVLYGKDPSLVSTAVIMRDVKVKAKTEPKLFLEKLQDPALTIQNDIRTLFDRGLLGLRNNNADVHFNLKDNKKRLLQVPEGSDPYQVCQEYFETEEGVATMKVLQQAYEDI